MSEKRFRFRDEELDDETSPTGVTRFLKTLKDCRVVGVLGSRRRCSGSGVLGKPAAKGFGVREKVRFRA